MKLNKIIIAGLLCGICVTGQNTVVAGATTVDTAIISNNKMTQENDRQQDYQDTVTGAAIVTQSAVNTATEGAVKMGAEVVTNAAVKSTTTGAAVEKKDTATSSMVDKKPTVVKKNNIKAMSVVKPAAKKKSVKKKSVKKKSVKKKKYTETELKYMSCIIYCEAGCEPYAGKKAVGIVVMNRKKSASFPNSVKGVIYQKHQFGPVSNGSLARALRRYESGKFVSATEKACIKAAKAVLNGDKMVKYNGRNYNMKSYHFFSRRVAGAKLTIKHHQFK